MQDMDPVTKTIVDSNPLKLRTMVECSECKVRGLGAFILQEDKGDNVFIPMSDKQFVEVSNHPTGGLKFGN
jgi:hypothetical protein